MDLDGVVRRWGRENDRRAEREAGLPSGVIRQAAFAPGLLLPAITGAASDEEWRRLVAARLAHSFPGADAQRAKEIWSASAGTVDAEVVRLLRACRCRTRVVLVTNATSRLPADLECLGIAHEFDEVVNSSAVGFVKPHADIYRQALAAARAEPVEAVMIDDLLENVRGAMELGISGHVYRDVQTLAAFLCRHGLIADMHPHA